MINGNNVWEDLNNIIEEWEICTLDSKGIFGGLCSSWNPYKSWFNDYHSLAGIVLEGKFQGCNYEVKIINFYGPYSQRKSF